MMIYTTTWINLENIMSSKISKFTEREDRLVVAEDWESGKWRKEVMNSDSKQVQVFFLGKQKYSKTSL